MKQLGKYREDIQRFGVILAGLVSALVLFWKADTLGKVILSFIVVAVLALLMFKFI